MARIAKAKPPKWQPKPKAKAKIGRPPKIVDDEKTLQTLSGLARIQCTTKEAAAVLAVSEPTFIDFLKRSEKARETWDNNQQSGRASLRRMQFKTAESGNATMQIWLGKQYLGQRDRSETELTGKDGGPIETRQTLDLSKLTDDELAAYQLLSAASARNRAGDQPPAVH